MDPISFNYRSYFNTVGIFLSSVQGKISRVCSVFFSSKYVKSEEVPIYCVINSIGNKEAQDQISASIGKHKIIFYSRSSSDHEMCVPDKINVMASFMRFDNESRPGATADVYRDWDGYNSSNTILFLSGYQYRVGEWNILSIKRKEQKVDSFNDLKLKIHEVAKQMINRSSCRLIFSSSISCGAKISCLFREIVTAYYDVR